MLKNYFKIAVRNLLRNKAFSIINISGLAIGMASAILILLWIQNELGYDRFHEKGDRLYQVWSNDEIDGSIRSMTPTPEIMAPTLKKDYPEIENVTRVCQTRNLFSAGGEKKLLSTGAVVDPGFLEMFSFSLVKGNKKNVWNDPYSIVVTEKLAKKLFGDQDPVGKTVRMGNTQNFTVTGVLKDFPNNTQFDYFEYLLSYEQKTLTGNIDKDWSNFSISTFVLLKPNSSPEGVSKKIQNIVAQHTNGGEKTQEFLYPVSRLWLYSEFKDGKAVGGRITLVRTFSIIAIFILLIACINFMNLSTARSEKRAKEVGIRKVAGAMKRSLIAQFLGESVLIALVAGGTALLIVQLVLPAFNQLMGKQLRIGYGNPGFWLSGIGFILFTGILAGSYPAFVLSAFKPVAVLKGRFSKMNALLTPRKVLVVLQFTFAIALIICTMVVTEQINYAQGRKAGYDKDHLVSIFLNDEMGKNFRLIKNDLLNTGIATAVSKVHAPLTQNWSSGNALNWEGKDPTARVQINRTSEEGDLIKTAGMQLITGRDIDLKNYPSDSTACLINESALRLMKFKNPIGQVIFDDPVKWHVVGVIKDYVQESPYQPIKPMIVKGPKEWMGVILVKLNRQNSTTANIAGMEKIFKQYNPAYPLEYTFTDQEYAQKFSDEQLIGKLAGLFAGLTIFISCLGLFGLASFTAENRTKEIGVRKILGASVMNIVTLLSKDFLSLVFLAIVIAGPLSWWAMTTWLEGYDYRITISGWVFLYAGLAAVLIALLTVSYQSIKAALTNPVKNLRTE